MVEVPQKAADVAPTTEAAKPKPGAPPQAKPETPKVAAPKPVAEPAPKA